MLKKKCYMLLCIFLLAGCSDKSESKAGLPGLPEGDYAINVNQQDGERFFLTLNASSGEMEKFKTEAFPEPVSSYLIQLEAELNSSKNGSMQVTNTDHGAVLMLRSFTGEPMINERNDMAYFRDGRLIDSDKVSYGYGNSVNRLVHGSNILIHNGKSLRIYNDKNGEKIETLDMTKIGQQDDVYYVEEYSNHFLLIRPRLTDTAVLYESASKQATRLYQQLFDAKCRLSIEARPSTMAGVPTGDGLKLTQYKQGTLYFEVTPGPDCGEKRTLTYELVK